MVGSAAEASSIGFPVWEGVLFAVAYLGRDMWMWLAAACFVVAAFLFFCVPITRNQSRWYREQIRLSTRGWMWNCASLGSTLRSKSRIRIDRGCTIGVRSKSRLFLPGLGSIRGVVLGHLARTKMLGLSEQFGVARLLEDMVEFVYTRYPLSVIRGLVHPPACSRVAQICRKTVPTWLSFCFLMIRRIRGKSLAMVAVESWRSIWWCRRFWVARPSGFSKKEQFDFLFVLQSISEGTSWKTAES